MALSLRQLEVLNAVLTAGTMSGAARLLRISQPAVSRTVAATEQQLGVALFTREGSSLAPTPELLELGGALRPIFTQVEAAQNVAAVLRFGAGRTLRLAATPAFVSVFLPATVARFRERFPQAQVIVKVREAGPIKEGVASGDFDLGMVYNEKWRGPLDSVEICRSEIVCLLPDGHPLAAAQVVTPRDFRGEPLISFTHTSQIGADLDRIFEAEGETRDVAVAVGDSFLAASFVRSGSGVALTDPFALGAPGVFGLVARPFRPVRPLIPRVVYAPGRRLSVPEATVIDDIAEIGRTWMAQNSRPAQRAPARSPA